jgi:hypothetical protein
MRRMTRRTGLRRTGLRRIGLAGMVLAGLTVPLLTAGPASAGGGRGPIAPGPAPSPVSCSGNTCSENLAFVIKLSGDVGSGGGHFAPVDVPPPPCLWVRYGDAITGSQKIVDTFGDNPPDVFNIPASVTMAKALLKAPQPGEWFNLPINPAAGEAGALECLKLPAFVFVPPGTAPPAPPVPPETIAAFAYNHMTIPLPQLTVSPANKGYVNLASYVWANWPVSRVTGQEDTYQIVARAGDEVVTVQATAADLSVTATGPGNANSGGCGPNGSASAKGHAPASAGAGTPPDCGVLWLGPDAQAGISATARWTVTWWEGAGGPRTALPDIVVSSPVTQMQVAEIQSINNGG